MKLVYQDAFGKPDGNCFTACVACLLGVKLDDVRDLEEIYREAARQFEYDEGGGDQQENWFTGLERYNDALAERFGVRIAYLEINGPGAPKGYSIAGGRSPRGEFDHCVVAHNGMIIHDPHPSRDGLKGAPTVYGFLVPVVRVP